MVLEVGKLSTRVIELLDLSLRPGQPIYLGESNIEHMINRHSDDYERFGDYISDILSFPDYVGKNPKDSSIEFVKEFRVEDKFVKVAVRLSGGGALYVRSLYTLNQNRVYNFIHKGTLKKV